jgi:hypothetical protein
LFALLGPISGHKKYNNEKLTHKLTSMTLSHTYRNIVGCRPSKR